MTSVCHCKGDCSSGFCMQPFGFGGFSLCAVAKGMWSSACSRCPAEDLRQMSRKWAWHVLNRRSPATVTFDKMMGVGNHYCLHLSKQWIFRADVCESKSHNTNQPEQIVINEWDVWEGRDQTQTQQVKWEPSVQLCGSRFYLFVYLSIYLSFHLRF